jgi:hypothetical protein
VEKAWGEEEHRSWGWGAGGGGRTNERTTSADGSGERRRCSRRRRALRPFLPRVSASPPGSSLRHADRHKHFPPPSPLLPSTPTHLFTHVRPHDEGSSSAWRYEVWNY